MRIELEIDELEISGFNPRDRFRIQTIVEHELARLISANGRLQPLLVQSGGFGRLSDDISQSAADLAGDAINSSVAQTLYRALKR